jgi:hypothetical protein
VKSEIMAELQKLKEYEQIEKRCDLLRYIFIEMFLKDNENEKDKK